MKEFTKTVIGSMVGYVLGKKVIKHYNKKKKKHKENEGLQFIKTKDHDESSNVDDSSDPRVKARVCPVGLKRPELYLVDNEHIEKGEE